MLRTLTLALMTAAAIAVSPSAQTPGPATGLRVYVIDTEGGKAVLWITPAGQTVLVDSGNPGGRDTDRLMDAVKDAGVTRIDYLISTHYHIDHIGGLPELARRIPIGTFVDHGPSVEAREQVPNFQATYKDLYDKARHLVVKPGDTLPLSGVSWLIVTAGGGVLKTPLPGAGRPNPTCASFQPKEITNDPENPQSVGSLVTYGRFRSIDLADLLWNNEHELMCPANPIGTVDLYMVSHHGTDPSGSPQLVHALAPRVAVMQNGARKGAGAQAMPTMRTSPGLEDIWQLHWGYGAGLEQNSAGVFIANVEDNQTVASVLTAPPRGGGPGRQGPLLPPGAGGANPPPGPQGLPPGVPSPGAAQDHAPAYWIKVVAQQDGSFTVSNSRNGFSKTYAARPRDVDHSGRKR